MRAAAEGRLGPRGGDLLAGTKGKAGAPPERENESAGTIIYFWSPRGRECSGRGRYTLTFILDRAGSLPFK